MRKGFSLPRTDTSSHRDQAVGSRRQVDPLTDIERKILDFMVQYLRANTYQPSIREIGRRFGIKSTKTVSEHLQALADKGFLERDPSRSRGVKILGVDLSAQTVAVPCFSTLPSDSKPLKSESAEFHLSIDQRLAGSAGVFFVRAGAGDLAVVGVQEGDFVLVEPSDFASLEDGAIVVARTGTGSWFHRFSRSASGLELESLRPGGERTVVADPSSVHMLGRVTAFYRRLDDSAGALNLTQH